MVLPLAQRDGDERRRAAAHRDRGDARRHPGADARCGKIRAVAARYSRERARGAHVDLDVARCPHRQRRPSLARPARALAAIALVLLAGCASRTPAPVEDRARSRRRAAASAVAAAPRRRPRRRRPKRRAPTYTVKRGDTLYQIALDHGLDYRELAAWNNIENVNLIRVGQVLRLTAPGEASRQRPPASRRRRCAPRRRWPSRRPGAAGAARPSPRRRRRRATPTTTSRSRRRSRSRTPSRRCARRSARRRARRRRRRRGAGVSRAPPPRRRPRRSAPTPPRERRPTRRRRRRQARLGVAGQGQGRRRVLRDGEPEGHRHRRQRRPAGRRQRGGQGRLRGHGPARLRQAHHRQAQQDVPVRLRAQPRHPGEGRPAGRAGPEDRGDGQHRHRPGEAAFRDPPAWASRWIRRRYLPPA